MEKEFETPALPDKSKLTYSSYLRVDDLLKLQEPLSSPLAHDEMLFIIVHQTYELWFKQILFEADALVDLLEQDDVLSSLKFLGRINTILGVLTQQIDVLETMSPVDFNRFRSLLNPASGFQSLQFRELELISGADPASYVRLLALSPEWKPVLEARLGKATLRSAFIDLLARRKILLETSTSPSVKGVEAALLKIYEQSGHRDLHALCEEIIGYDEQFLHWRFRHVQMVERMIGMKKGTGGSLGVEYLQKTLDRRFFPELWSVRTLMGA